MTAPSVSQAITSLSPTRLEPLRVCPLQLAFIQDHDASGHQKPPTALLGTMVHEAFAQVILSGEISGEDPLGAFEQAWAHLVSESAASGADPSEWPATRRAFKRALRRVPALAALISEYPDCAPEPEQLLETADGTLRGFADLVIRSANGTVIVDHKTGAGSDDNELKAPYERQLVLYAAIEMENTGLVPARVAILSTVDNWTDVAISRSACEDALAEARALRNEYNQRVPGAQPPHTGEHCGTCDYSPRCDPFWEHLDPYWLIDPRGQVRQAVKGTVTEDPTTAEMGILTIKVAPTRTTVTSEDVDGEVILTGFVAEEHPGLAGAQQGDEIAVVGLRLSESSTTETVLLPTGWLRSSI